jgi:hypothetical protein
LTDPARHLASVAADYAALGALNAAVEAAALGGRGWLSPGAAAPPHVGAAARLARAVGVAEREQN